MSWGSDSLPGRYPALVLASLIPTLPLQTNRKAQSRSPAHPPDAHPYRFFSLFRTFSVSTRLWRFGAVVRGRRIGRLDGQAGRWSSKGRKSEGTRPAGCWRALLIWQRERPLAARRNHRFNYRRKPKFPRSRVASIRFSPSPVQLESPRGMYRRGLRLRTL